MKQDKNLRSFAQQVAQSDRENVANHTIDLQEFSTLTLANRAVSNRVVAGMLSFCSVSRTALQELTKEKDAYARLYSKEIFGFLCELLARASKNDASARGTLISLMYPHAIEADGNVRAVRIAAIHTILLVVGKSMSLTLPCLIILALSIRSVRI